MAPCPCRVVFQDPDFTFSKKGHPSCLDSLCAVPWGPQLCAIKTMNPHTLASLNCAHIASHMTALTSFRRGVKYYYLNYSPEGENAAASVKRMNPPTNKRMLERMVSKGFLFVCFSTTSFLLNSVKILRLEIAELSKRPSLYAKPLAGQ